MMRTAIVTGAGSGIGRAVAARLAFDGLAVLCADLNQPAAEETAAQLAKAGYPTRAVGADITDEAAVSAMVAQALDWTGRIDTCVANAGAMIEGDILSLSLDDWNRALHINATGAFLTARAVLPHLLVQGGTLVFTASTVGLSGMKGVAAYSAAKGAVVALTRQLAADFAARGVRVNAVAPGAVRTPLSESQFRARAVDEDAFQTLLAQVIGRYPISRWGTPEEIAEVVLFLATERSSWMTGQIIPVDGGLLELR
ncbi:SDR family NAD(P)-dependent oxidoreductase [Pseudorhodobacter sp. MZDSW-24AT]|uniref:SDR family NAD(P)-dependent oxidoreductase n=1 Tax=Pseudorhodobacter sp. MZDSW-24AT TaxID=2052957 RepID=UPI000C1F6CE5|nr:SDR family NAD(P)-dependent oxidoreductase [Pseudorhodobacter sp. MZDSW-24AT]PJF08541.1 oxidoreductase [Pseudorhodobacter sp. MZDSW-24AT]